MSAMGPGCVKTSTSRERAELFSLFAFFDGARQRYSFLIELIRGKRSTRKSDFGVFTQPGSKAENLNTSTCLPLFIQQRTFLRTAASRQKRSLDILIHGGNGSSFRVAPSPSAIARARPPHRHHNPTGAGSLHHSGNMWTMLHQDALQGRANITVFMLPRMRCGCALRTRRTSRRHWLHSPAWRCRREGNLT
jgi:hypothetical protein